MMKIRRKAFAFLLSGILFMPQMMIAESNIENNVSIIDSADIRHRQYINEYIVQYRNAYETKDLGFFKCLISNGLFLTWKKSHKKRESASKYSKKNVRKYFSHLQDIFDGNNNISINIDDIEIVRHPIRHTFYGVTFHQDCQPDNSKNNGYIFTLWDFHNENTPAIHVYVWQPDEYDSKEKRFKRISKDEMFGLIDFDI